MSTASLLVRHLKGSQSLRSVVRAAEWFALQLVEAGYDARYNIRTRPDDIRPAFADDEGYDPVSFPGMKQIERRVGISPGEVVVDIGCGRGRALCLLSRHPGVTECVGIEYHAGHAQIARQNARSVRGRMAPISIIEGDAAHQDYERATLLLLYNPFGETTMRRVAERVRQSFQRRPRTIRIVYVNPKFEHVLAEQAWLTRVDAFSIPNRLHRSLPASVWHSTIPAVERQA